MAPGGARVRPQLPAARRARRARAEPARAAASVQGAAGGGLRALPGGAGRRRRACGCRSQRDDVDPIWHLYPLRVLDGRRREVFDAMRAAGIGVQVNYIPVVLAPDVRGPRLPAWDVPQRGAVLRRGALAADARRARPTPRSTRSSTPCAPLSEADPCTTPTTSTGTRTSWPATSGSRSPRASGATSSTAGTCTTGSPWARFRPGLPQVRLVRRPAPVAAGPPDCATTVVGAPVALPARAGAAARVARVGGAARGHHRLPVPRLGGPAGPRQPHGIHRGDQGDRGRRPDHRLPALERVRQPQGAARVRGRRGPGHHATASAATCGRTPTSPSSTGSSTRCAGTGASSATG